MADQFRGRRNSLQFQFFSRVILLLVVVVPILGAWRYVELARETARTVENERQIMAKVLAVTLRDPSWSLDYDQIDSIMLARSADESLISVEIEGIELGFANGDADVRRYTRDPENHLTPGVHDSRSARETVLVPLQFDVMREGKAISRVRLFFTNDLAEAQVRRGLLSLLLNLALTGGLIALLLYFLVHTYVGRPIAMLQESIDACGDGEDFKLCDDCPDNEIRRFAESYGAIYNELRQHQTHLQTLVDSRTRDLNLTNQKLQSEIDQRIAIEEDLVRARVLAEQASQAKSQFLAHISHELRTPLNGIIGYAQLLAAKPDLPPDVGPFADNIRRCGDHLLRLINNILDLSKIEASQMERHDEPVSLHLMAHDIRTIVLPRAQEKGLNLLVDIPPDVPDWVQVDGEKLRQILVNLLGNAIKFTASGSVSLCLQCTPERRLKFSVVDTGRGIPEADRARIFDAFQQSQQVNRTSGEGGTGLGLAISRKLVALLGGELKLSSEVGKGSCFWFELRLVSTSERPVPASRRPIKALAAGQQARILIVDDVYENRHVLSLQLEQAGFSTAMAESGDAALRLLYEFEPDLVMMDIQMPGMDGIEASQLIHRKRPDLPIVAFTASVFDKQLAESARGQFLGTLFKPVAIDDAFRLIGELLNLRYIYQDEASVPVRGATPEAEAQFGRLDEAQREELRTWLANGNISRIRDLGKALEAGEAYPELGALLHRLARSYQLDALEHLLAVNPETSKA